MSKMKDASVKGSTGTWPNGNTSEKICYDINALKQMKDGPLSKNKPQTTSQLEAYDLMRRSPVPDYNFSLASIQRPKSDFLPTFVQDPYSKTSSKDLRKDGKPSIFNGKSSMKIISPNTLSPLKTGTIRVSLREDVKLNQSENAWVPSRLKNEDYSKEEQKTQDLYKTFRGILNKLTPEKFDKLMEKIKSLEIDTQERLEGVIDLVFEKAIYEPKYSKAYAVMCNKLGKLQVPVKNATSPDQCVFFRTVLISRCQKQFETKKVDESIIKLEDEISKCSDPAKKKELQVQLEEENRNVRMRSVGNVRFIGELYKLNMLTGKIIIFCLNNLVEIQEEKLECLCKLLTTIGEQVENEAKDHLNVVFKKMQDIVDKKGAVSSRVRFMLEDVIALRRRRWVGRGIVDLQPQTMEQIQREAEMQQRHIEMMNATPQRRDGGAAGGGGSGGAGRRRGDRRAPLPHHEPPRQHYSVDTNKLKAGVNRMQSLSATKLAPQNFGWIGGAGLRSPHAPPAPPPPPAALSNKYSLLTDSDDSPALPPPPASAPVPLPAAPRTTAHTSDSLSPSRSSDDERVHEPSCPLPAVDHAPLPAPSSGPHPPRVPEVAVPSARPKNMEKKSELRLEDPFEMKRARVGSTIGQFLVTADAAEVAEEARRLCPPDQHASLVAEILNQALDKSLKETAKIAQLIVELVNTESLSPRAVEAGLGDLMALAPDIVLDVPRLYDYVACFVSAFVQNEILSLAQLYDMSFAIISSGRGRLLLKNVLSLLVEARDEDFVSGRWRESRLSLDQWMDKDEVAGFIEENNLHFLGCDEIQKEVRASGGCTGLGETTYSTDMENHSDAQTTTRADSGGAAAPPATETHLNRTEDFASCQNISDVHNANINEVKKDISPVDRDENLNLTEKRQTDRIEELDLENNSGMNSARRAGSDRTENTSSNENNNENDTDSNNDENFNRLSSRKSTPSKNDDAVRIHEKNLHTLENLESGSSRDLNGIDVSSSECEAVEDLDELCLEERLLALMEAGERGDRVLEWLKRRASQRPADTGAAARALTRALCRYALDGANDGGGVGPERLYDERRLRRYRNVVGALGAEARCGLDCVLGVQDLIQRKMQHQEALLSVLQYLLEENVVPLEALSVYEQFVNAQPLV